MMDEGLEKLGFDQWTQNAGAESLKDDFLPARVIEVNKNNYLVSNGRHEMVAELSGKFLFDADRATDFPTVGDWVVIQALDDFTLAVIHGVFPRKTLLKRKEPGKRIDFQLIAANIDIGLVVQSAQHLNFNLMDRYFVMLNESKIRPVAVFNKIDLLSSAEIQTLEDTIAKLNTDYLLISTVADAGLDQLSDSLVAGKTYCLLGQSGVGKTSLLNRLLHAEVLRVSEVREKDGKGRHTTVKRQLVRLDCGAIFIDTPGMRELGNFEIDQGLNQTFDEFSGYALECRFRDCTHTHEQGCAILEAVNNGVLDENRYKNFLKLKKESDFYEMSYQQKRKKEKSFGKMVKNYKKFKKKL